MYRRPFLFLQLLLLLPLATTTVAQEPETEPADDPIAAAVKARMDRGSAFYKAKEYAKAEREFEKAAKLDKSHALAHLWQGYCRYYQKNYAGAIECYTATIEADPGHAGRGHYARGQARALLKKHEGAVEDFSAAIAKHGNWAAAYHYRANSLFELTRLAEAARDYERSIELQKNNWSAWMQRARVSEAMGDYDAAEKVYSQLIEANPKYTSAYIGRGRCRALLGKRTDAEFDFGRAIREAPDDPTPLCQRARIHMLFHDFKRALEDCDAARKIDPKHYYPYFIRGLVKYNYGKFRPARADMRKAIKKMEAMGQEPDYLHLYLCLVQRRIGKHEEALADLKKYYAQKKKKPEEWYTQIVSFLTGKIDEATFLKSAVDETPKRTRERRCEAYFYAGTCRLIDGDKTKANVYFREAIDTDVISFMEYETSKIALAQKR